MDSVNWGMIGCGDVTEVKSGPAFGLVAHSRLVAVMRRNGDKARDYAERHGVPKWYDDAEALICDPSVNAVYVATPPSSHEEYVVKAAAAGKAVYVEKPMARRYDECDRMIRACAEAGVPLFVAYYRRRLPAYLKVKELIKEKAIGEVRFVRIALWMPPFKEDFDSENPPWRVAPEIAGAGRFLDLAAHQLDFLDYALGPIAEATGHAANHMGLYPAEDAVSGSFIFESGVLGNGTWCFSVAESCATDRTEIVGGKGKIVYPTFAPGPVELFSDTGVEAFELPPPKHVQQPLIQTIVDELRGKGVCPSSGVTGARTTRVMDAILEGWRAS